MAEEENLESFIKLAENELSIGQDLGKASFNPTLVSLGLRLASADHAKAKDVARKIAAQNFDNVMHPQIVCSELLKQVEGGIGSSKRPRLEYL